MVILRRLSSFSYGLRDWLTRFAENRLASVGTFIVASIMVVALFAPQLVLHDAVAMAVRDRLAPLLATHPLGTDQFRRDAHSRVVYGTRISIIAGVEAVGIALIAGVLLGPVAGGTREN